MKLQKKKLLVVSFMLFSLFFGAGNLIFPPFLGQNAGKNTLQAMLGFLMTAVILPVLGVVVVAKFDGLDKLGQRVNRKFAFVFTLLIYLSIGPGLGIPRAASVPFEMAVSPYLPGNMNKSIVMLIYSAVFFAIALWLCLNPGKLVDRIGHFLTPALLSLLCILFVSFVCFGNKEVADASATYLSTPFLKGFQEGYNTMDTVAALNFGLVISTTLSMFGLEKKNDRVRYTAIAGIFAGMILATVYIMLAYMGMHSSGIYEIQENGAWLLRCIVKQIFGEFGAIFLASIFTLACLTTCVGLINSISLFFSKLFKKTQYRFWVFVITVFSFFICNLGLNMILEISIPVLNAIYPVAIVLIILGLTDDLWRNNQFIYPLTICGTTIVSVIYACDVAGVKLGILSKVTGLLPMYETGFGWVSVAFCCIITSVFISLFQKKSENY